MTAEEYLELGHAYVQEKNWEPALNALLESQKYFKELEEDATPPLLLSLLGLSQAMARNNIEVGVSYCQRAIAEDSLQEDFYHHLGLVYLKAGDKKKAITVFKKGLRLSPNHSGIWSRIAQLGLRKRPLLPFLPRQHFLNRFIGMWLAGPGEKPRTAARRIN
ncbi:MAG: tetratricopeptide repeat protein [Nitrospirae bacterium]|nr:tetratricopeptide repeat protein [Candidatus Manganitrophaceae bacterium]